MKALPIGFASAEAAATRDLAQVASGDMRPSSWGMFPGRLALLVALPAFLILTTRFVSDYVNAALVLAGIGVIVAAGLHVLVHWAGQVSLGQVAFVGIGAFATANLNGRLGLPLVLALAGGMVASTLASLAVGLPALRVRGFALAVTTLVLAFAMDQWLFRQEWFAGTTGVEIKARSILGLRVESSRDLIVAVIVLAAIVLAFTSRLGSSPLGRRLRVVAVSEEVASSYGINVAAYKVVAFLYAGACAGLAGGVWAMSLGRVGPTVFHPALSILYLAAVLLGGPGSVAGSAAAAAGLGVFPFFAGYLGRYSDLIASSSLLLVVAFFSGGINELNRRMRKGLMDVIKTGGKHHTRPREKAERYE